MIDYSKYKTDEERLAVVDKMPYWDWNIVAGWEEEAKDPKARRIFHSRSRSMAHTEEFYNCGEI